jgi:hypothetical protein
MQLQLNSTTLNSWNRDSADGVMSGYRLDDLAVGVRVPVGSRVFSISSRPVLGFNQPPMGIGGKAAVACC